MKIYQRFFKRPMDIVLSGAALVVLSPVMATVAVLVRTKLGSPVLFKQARPGLNEEIFYMYKFRTMTDERDENGELLPNHLRHTSFGKMLRSTSLDELPGLLNVIKGDMSVIGPRPLLVDYLPLYSQAQKKRHNVRPGLSGLAQIKGRNALSWSRKFAYDVQYVNSVSFLTDVKIILLTLKKVFARDGINQTEGITMERFNGQN